MGYCEDDSMVRVDFFRSSGKWYTSEAVKWTGNYDDDIFESFEKSLCDHFEGTNRLSEMDAVCLKPYHKYSHPIQIKSGRWNK